MSQLLKARIKWGTIILAGLAVSIFTADDRCDSTRISSPGLTKKLLSKAEVLTSPFFYFFTNEQEPSNESASETQKSQRRSTSQKVEPSDQELKMDFIGRQSKGDRLYFWFQAPSLIFSPKKLYF